MPTKKSNTRARLTSSVVEARAGLIPASDDVTDEIRALMNHAAKALRALSSRAGAPKSPSEQGALTEILVSISHYCELKGFNFDDLIASAHAQYLNEDRLVS